MKKPKKKVNPNRRWIVITFKMNHEEMRKALGKAHVNHGGNMSKFIRAAITKY